MNTILYKPKCYLCLSLFDENCKQTNTKNKTERKSKTGKKRVCLCVKVWCMGNTVLIHVYICVDLVKRGVITIVGETPRYRNDSCCSAYHQHSISTISTVCLPSRQYAYHQHSMPTINTVCLPSTQSAYHQHSLPSIKTVCLPSTQSAFHQDSMPTINTVCLPSTQYA